MAIDRSKLSAIIAGHARTLCSPEGDKLIDSYKKSEQIKNTPSNIVNEAYGYDEINSREMSTINGQVNDIQYSYDSLISSKLPEHIKESFINQRIDVSGTGGISVLDEIGVKPVKKKINELKTQPTTQPQYTPIGNNIDYSIIKAIVNECLNEYFSKNMINENTSLQTIALKNGNISLVDNKGNIFKAKLEKIGNKNDKK